MELAVAEGEHEVHRPVDLAARPPAPGSLANGHEGAPVRRGLDLDQLEAELLPGGGQILVQLPHPRQPRYMPGPTAQASCSSSSGWESRSAGVGIPVREGNDDGTGQLEVLGGHVAFSDDWQRLLSGDGQSSPSNASSCSIASLRERPVAAESRFATVRVRSSSSPLELRSRKRRALPPRRRTRMAPVARACSTGELFGPGGGGGDPAPKTLCQMTRSEISWGT